MILRRSFKLFLVLSLFLFAAQILGYDTYVIHPKLTESAIEIYNKQSANKLNYEQKSWIITGSINEDTFPRYSNHFYNPTTGEGLDYGGFTSIAAKEWAKNQSGAISGDYSISAVLNNYKEGNFRRAYEGVGHILHLVQDMAVPAHTRNDVHIDGDPYEAWAKQYGNVNSDKVSFISVSNIDQVFDNLAGHSYNNFFSKDTIDNSILDKIQDYKIEKNIEKEKTEYGYYNNYKIIKIKRYIWGNEYSLDFRIHLDYWNMLHPQAVGYSAGVIDYFAKQFEQIDREKKEQLSLADKAKNELAKLWGSAKYSWGDIFFATWTRAENTYYALKNTAVNSWQNIAFFGQANKEIANQTAQTVVSIAQKSAESVKNPPIKLEKLFSLTKAGASINGNAAVSDSKTGASAKTELGGVAPAQGVGGNDEDIKLEDITELVPVSGSPEINSFNDGDGNIEIFVKPRSASSGRGSNFVFTAGDSIPPDTTVNKSVAAISSSTNASFIFYSSESGGSFECNLDSGGWHACGQDYNLINLTEGAHNLKARAIDAAGNIDPLPADFNWIIDITAPAIFIAGRPTAFASSTVADFQFASDDSDASYQYKLDSGGWQTSNATTSLGNLTEGEHQAEVRAKDAAGNTGSSTIYAWLIDLTAPSASVDNLNAGYEATGFAVKWSGADTGVATTSGVAVYDVEYKIEGGDWQAWQTAVTATSSIFNVSMENSKNIYFRVRARDNAGNTGGWSAEAQTKIDNHIANHIVISEFATRGAGGAYDEFVELYNPTDNTVNLTGWKLKSKPANGGDWTNRTGTSGLPGGVIAAKGYYLITAAGYSLSAIPDYRHSANWRLADNGGHIKIVKIIDNNEVEIDKVGYGAADSPEGTAFAGDLSVGNAERKTFVASTAATMASGSDKWQGNGYDSDNNANDFVLQTSANPQNSASPSEPRSDEPILPGAINDLTVQYAYTSSNSIKFIWAVPANANAADGAYYDLRYMASADSCNLQLNWNSATMVASSSLLVPASAGSEQSATVSGLAVNTTYCFAIRVFNGQFWSDVSNNIQAKTLASQTQLTQLKRGGEGDIIAQTLTPDKNPYYIDWSSDIKNGNILTIEPGVVIKFGPWYLYGWYNYPVILSVVSGGQIKAQGTSRNPVVFTSIYDDTYAGDSNNDGDATAPGAGNWGGMQISSSGNIFDYVVMKYGGADARGLMTFYNNENNIISHSVFSHHTAGITFSASPTSNPAVISYSDFSNFSKYAIASLSSAELSIIYNNIHDNQIGVMVSGRAVPTINHNNIYSNIDYGVGHNEWSERVFDSNARFNWWGSETGPTYSANPSGQGDKVTDKVDYSDWAAASY